MKATIDNGIQGDLFNAPPDTSQEDFTPDAFKHKDCPRELKAGEMWVGNTNTADGIPSHLSQMKTARLGEQAYYIDGKPIDRGYCRPLIIHKSEAGLYDTTMMNIMKSSRLG